MITATQAQKLSEQNASRAFDELMMATSNRIEHVANNGGRELILPLNNLTYQNLADVAIEFLTEHGFYVEKDMNSEKVCYSLKVRW